MSSEGRPRVRIPLKLWFFATLVVASLATCAMALVRGWIDVGTLQRLIARANGLEAAVTYVACAILFELLWLPRMWSLIAAGLLFGPALGIGLSAIADLGTAVICYSLARFAGRAYVGSVLRRREKARTLIALLAQRRGLATVFLIRALPVHYTASSYAAGLAGVPWRPYMLGTALGIVPGTLVFTVVGDAARDPSSPWFWVALGVVLVVVAVGLVVARRFWRTYRQLPSGPADEELPSGPPDEEL